MPLGGAKDEHFSCFHSSCPLGLSKLPVTLISILRNNLQIKEIWTFESIQEQVLG